MDDLARQLVDQQTMTQLVAAVLAFVALYLALAPIASCDRCPHCRAENAKKGRLLPFGDDDPVCPLHKLPRSRCQSQHED